MLTRELIKLQVNQIIVGTFAMHQGPICRQGKTTKTVAYSNMKKILKNTDLSKSSHHIY